MRRCIALALAPHPNRRRAAAARCRAERRTIGIRAFRAKYGPRHALRHCINRALRA